MCPNRSHAKEGWMQAQRNACSAADGVVKNNAVGNKLEPINPAYRGRTRRCAPTT